MGLTHIVKKMEAMLMDLATDLKKAFEKGNKAASQRVRTGTIQFAKLAKVYRKESIAVGKGEKSKEKKNVRSKPALLSKKKRVKREKAR